MQHNIYGYYSDNVTQSDRGLGDVGTFTWKPPPSYTFKVNTDATVDIGGDTTTFGMFIRDAQG